MRADVCMCVRVRAYCVCQEKVTKKKWDDDAKDEDRINQQEKKEERRQTCRIMLTMLTIYVRAYQNAKRTGCRDVIRQK